MPGIVGSLPNNIANAQVIDAGPVMANFNWLMNQVNANAASLFGANVFAQAIQAPAATMGVQLATAAQVQNGVNNAADSGVVDAYICAPAVPVTSYSNSQQFTMTTANTNTLTNPTLKISALAAKTIVNQDGSALLAGQITANAPLTYIYDSTLDKFRMSFAINKTSPSKLPTVTATVAASALTIGLAPQYLDFRSATLGSGTISTLAAAPANIVVQGSATLGTANAVAARLVVAAMNNAGTVELAVANTAGLVINEADLISTTALSGGSTSAAIWYSTTLRTNLPFRIVGYLDITEATAGTWATAPSTIQPITNTSHNDQTLFYQLFTTSGTWTKPGWLTGYETVEVEIWGGGGGGSSQGNSSGGGGGGAYNCRRFLASQLLSSETVTIGSGGAINSAGGTTSFGTTPYMYAYGGGTSVGTSSSGGGGGGGDKGTGGNGSLTSGGIGGIGWGITTAAIADADGVSDGGAGGCLSASGGSAFWGGAGGGAYRGTGPGHSMFGGGGGAGCTNGGTAVGTGGLSLLGGAGGNFNAAGTAPGGGGGGNGAGARGECRVRVYSLQGAI